MKKHKTKFYLVSFLMLLLILTSCNKSITIESKEESSKETKLETEKEKVTESLFSEEKLIEKEFSNILSILEYLNNGKYRLKIRIEQKDEISYTNHNQNVYAEFLISSDNLNNSTIIYQKDIKDLYPIQLVDNKMPQVTEVLIDDTSKFLTKEEHDEIKNKSKGLKLLVQIRDPEGYILQISNATFNSKLETEKEKVVESLFSEGVLRRKAYTNIKSILEYLDDDKYKIKIRIEQKDKIKFSNENQNVYADFLISSENLDNGTIDYKKNIEDLYPIQLIDGKIPMATEILIDDSSKFLTKEEHEEIKNKSRGLWLSVQLRDPEGYILEISNTIFSTESE